MDRWAGRVAIVTGASSGIGAATARMLAQNGLRVVGVARRFEKIQVSNFNFLNTWRNVSFVYYSNFKLLYLSLVS